MRFTAATIPTVLTLIRSKEWAVSDGKLHYAVAIRPSPPLHCDNTATTTSLRCASLPQRRTSPTNPRCPATSISWDACIKRCHEAYMTKKGQECNNENPNPGWMLDMECVEPDRDCLMDLKVESRKNTLFGMLQLNNVPFFHSSAITKSNSQSRIEI